MGQMAEKIKKEHGFTLMELAVAMALFGIVLLAAVKIYQEGVDMANAALTRHRLQLDGDRILEEMVDGLPADASVVGVRQAVAFDIAEEDEPSGFAYRTDEVSVTYYVLEGVLYRKTEDHAGSFQYQPGDTEGVVVWDHVESFQVSRKDGGLSLKLRLRAEDDKAGTITLQTVVFPRNLSP